MSPLLLQETLLHGVVWCERRVKFTSEGIYGLSKLYKCVAQGGSVPNIKPVSKAPTIKPNSNRVKPSVSLQLLVNGRLYFIDLRSCATFVKSCRQEERDSFPKQIPRPTSRVTSTRHSKSVAVVVNSCRFRSPHRRKVRPVPNYCWLFLTCRM